MSFERVLVANRGEIAIRVISAATDAGLTAVAVYSEDDKSSLHTKMADDAVPLQGRGVPAYLDSAAIVARRSRPAAMRCIPAMGSSRRIQTLLKCVKPLILNL